MLYSHLRAKNGRTIGKATTMSRGQHVAAKPKSTMVLMIPNQTQPAMLPGLVGSPVLEVDSVARAVMIFVAALLMVVVARCWSMAGMSLVQFDRCFGAD